MNFVYLYTEATLELQKLGKTLILVEKALLEQTLNVILNVT